MSKKHQLLPRVIRLVDAPRYLGIDKNDFNKKVRPLLNQISLGKRRVGFDRLDLDAWVEHHKGRDKCPINSMEDPIWDINEKQPVLRSVKGYGTLTRSLTDAEFTKALTQAASKKRSNT